AGAPALTDCSLGQVPGAVGVARLLIAGPPLRRVLLTVVDNHVAGREDPARGPDRDAVGGLCDLLPGAVGIAGFLTLSPPRRLPCGAVEADLVTLGVHRLRRPRLRSGPHRLQRPEPVCRLLVGRGRAAADAVAHDDRAITTVARGLHHCSALCLAQ